jgi:uncharacterized membrane protein
MLVVFPLGLFLTSVIFDIIYFAYAGHRPGFALVAFWNIALGIIGGLLAAVFGLVDWLAIPKGTRAKRIGVLHALTNVVVVGLFAISWFVRLSEPDYVVTVGAFALSLIAVALATVGGWLGGELVDRLGVGVDSGANLDAPSSLREKHIMARPTGPTPAS